jgi:hypothetical protein
LSFDFLVTRDLEAVEVRHWVLERIVVAGWGRSGFGLGWLADFTSFSVGMYATLEAVSRTAVKLLFVAMLALLATQAVSVPMCGSTPCERAYGAEAVAEQQIIFELPRVPAFARERQSASSYVSLLLAEPETVLFFQLPPPVFSLAS